MWGTLRDKLRDRSLVVGVLGLGYVGLPLALAFARVCRVFGIDVRPELVQALRRGEAPDQGVAREKLLEALDTRFTPTTDFGKLAECDVIIIAVGTPLSPAREPDLSQVENATREVSRRLRPGQFVIFESTSYPGTTEEIALPILEETGLRGAVDFGLAYSPERINPGDSAFALEEIPKLVGGIDAETTAFAHEFYSQVIHSVIPVSHAKVAEAAKIIENLFRAVNVALVNEVALIMERLDIDVWEAIEAASTKPFGFMPFYPGPGIGGHCIPVDPYYLSYRARKAGYMPRFIELSGEVNEYMKFHVIELLHNGLKQSGKKPAGSSVAILGIAFKKNVSDTRESPAFRVIEECQHDGMRVRLYDPHAKTIATRGGVLVTEPDLESAVAGADAAVILVDHDEFLEADYDQLTGLMGPKPVWVDARGVLKSAPAGSTALGLGRPSSIIPRRHAAPRAPVDALLPHEDTRIPSSSL